MLYASIAICGVSLLLCAIFLNIKRKAQKTLKQKESSVDTLSKKIESLSKERDDYHDRVLDLENIKGEAFQVKLRNEVTQVNIDFTKVEIVTMYAGVNILLERTKNPDDAKIYIELIEKINGFIENMKEEE